MKCSLAGDALAEQGLTMHDLAGIYAKSGSVWIERANRETLPNYMDGEDVAHDAFATGLQRVASPDLPPVTETPARYMRQTVVNQLLTVSRRPDVKSPPASLEELCEQPGADTMPELNVSGTNPDDIINLRGLLGVLKDRLSSDHFETLVRVALGGLTCAEVAELRGVKLGTAKSQLFYARQWAQAAIADADYPV
jgi:DNA-directed RNA polymerase specialized sigma24 family protein